MVFEPNPQAGGLVACRAPQPSHSPAQRERVPERRCCQLQNDRTIEPKQLPFSRRVKRQLDTCSAQPKIPHGGAVLLGAAIVS